MFKQLKRVLAGLVLLGLLAMGLHFHSVDSSFKHDHRCTQCSLKSSGVLVPIELEAIKVPYTLTYTEQGVDVFKIASEKRPFFASQRAPPYNS